MNDRIAGTCLASLFVLLAMVLLWVERAPPIVAGLAFVALSAGLRPHDVWKSITHNQLVWIVAAFLVWLLMSTIWSVAGDEALTRGVRIAAMLSVAVMLPVMCFSLPSKARDKARVGAIFACCLAIGLLLIETLFDMPLLRTARYLFNDELFVNGLPPLEERRSDVTYYQEVYLANRLSHLASIVAIILIPTAVALWQRGHRFVAAAAVLAGVYGLTLVPTQTPLLALIAGLGVAAVLLVPFIGRSSRVGWGGATLIAAGAVASPWFAQMILASFHDSLVSGDISIIHRVAIWDYAAGFISEQPIWGWGVEASRTLGREGADLGVLVPGHPYVLQSLPLHPHNASIQIWLELGGVGAVIFALFLFAMTRRIHNYSSELKSRAALFAGWVSGLAIAHLSYGIWQYWWIASLGLVVAMLALMFEPARDE